MGNQPSSPSPSPPLPPLPPLAPQCDLECQKQKDLSLLKAALDTATDNQVQDPAGYEKARIAYYTLLNGQGWLNTEKQRIAKEEVEPVVASYTAKFNALKEEQKSQSIFTSLANNLKAQENADQGDNNFLKKQLNKEKDKADVLNRLATFDNGNVYNNYFPIIIDIIIGVLMLSVLYFAFTKLDKIKNLFGMSSTTVDGSIT